MMVATTDSYNILDDLKHYGDSFDNKKSLYYTPSIILVSCIYGNTHGSTGLALELYWVCSLDE